ncbi:hypothetical protein GGR56DRAFT_481062 [Xylariaceae sp. FL0804]|nr:hypothetical protein GGR56DRAFT_481062 [Xylariaceae sp. FL0804]
MLGHQIFWDKPSYTKSYIKVYVKTVIAQEAGIPVSLTALATTFTTDTISHYAYGVSIGCLDDVSGRNILSEAAQSVLAMGHWLKGRYRAAHPPDHQQPRARRAQRLRAKGAALEHVRRAGEPRAAARAAHAGPPRGRGLRRPRRRHRDDGIQPQRHRVLLARQPGHLRQPLRRDQGRHAKGHRVPAAVGPRESAIASVVNEGLRLSLGTLTRHPRVAPDRVLHYKNWAIPPGVIPAPRRPLLYIGTDPGT